MSPPALATPQAFREKAGETHFGEALPAQSQELLQARIKDLRLHLSGTPLERHIEQLYTELGERSISLRPQCYLSDQWGCPSGVPVIGLPFYLADPNLVSIEAALGGGAETDRDIQMYLRHEAGHCFNYAHKLYETEEWKKLFGDYSRPYHEDYKPHPFSKKYVVHISGWYAQKHPDEDFAETFAVFLTPGSDWETRYKGWGALKKLQYVQAMVEKLGKGPAVVNLEERDLDVDQMEETVLDHYRIRALDEKVDMQLGEHLDQDLVNLFEGPQDGAAGAAMLLRAERADLLESVTRYTGVSRPVVKSLLDHLLERAQVLGLTVQRDHAKEYVMRFTALLSALSMNYLYTDRFFEVE